MNKSLNFNKIVLLGLLSFSPVASFAAAPVFDRGNWGRVVEGDKRETQVAGERQIERRRVNITQRTEVREGPRVFRDDVEFTKLRQIKIDKKTEELISQLENLINRPGQGPRKGELNMRLAELYYERSQGIAKQESELWEKQMRKWDALSTEDRKKTPRPQLRTPEADQYRKKALRLYSELEKQSRGSDKGRSKMIRRDEVLFFLGSTLLDLGSRKQGLPFFDELVEKFPSSERAFAGRLTLADLYFENAKYSQALPHYLRIATSDKLPPDASYLRPYSIYKLAWCYLNTQQHDKAVMAFQKTLDESRKSKNERRVAFEREALTDLAWAFALASQYDRGEKYFDDLDDKELQTTFRKNAAEISRDRGEYPVAKSFYEKLLKEDSKAPESRDYALQISDIYKRLGDISAYAKSLAEVALNYGEDSRWLRSYEGSSEEKAQLVEENVSVIRREAKALHSAAQKKDKPDLYQKARPLYEAYFKVVPEPNPDKAENIHEMHFYFGELLYKIGDYKAAAKIYGETGEGKYGPQAAYARVLSLQSLVKKDPSAGKELARATEDFVKEFPEDDRAGEILYSGAYQAFNAGDTSQSLETLRKLVEKFASSSRGVESAERILFIHEKKGELDVAIEDANKILANETLMKTGGKEFESRIKEYQAKARFKKIDAMSDGSAGDSKEKAQAYLDIAQASTGETKEKALNNALVFAKKANDAELSAEAQNALLKAFPSSPFAKNIYFQKGEQAAKNGAWAEALKNYDAFLKAYKKDSPEAEKALWNSIYIRAHLEDVAQPRLNPHKDMSADLLQDSKEYLAAFPKGPNREAVISYLAFRKGATLADIKGLERGALKDEKEVLAQATLLSKVRAKQDLESLVKSGGASNEDHIKEALAWANFYVTEPRFEKYQKTKLNYKNFGPSLREKLGSLEKLEKDYLKVVSYGNGELALKSLSRLSSLYRSLGQDIDKAPAAKEELAQFSKPLFDKSLSFLKSCLEKSQEFKIAGPGLESCRQDLAQVEPASTPQLSSSEIPQPKWIATLRSDDQRPLFKVTTAAFAGGRLGEFSLGAGLLEKAETPLTLLERAEIDNMMGIWNWRVGKGQAAVKLFRKVSDLEGGELASVRTAAFKNLSAIYLLVGDFNSAWDVAQNLSRDDADAALLQSFILRSQGKNAEAASALDSALSKNRSNSTLLYNKALALGFSGQYPEAVKLLQQYLEVETPEAGHPARSYLRKWRSQIK